MKSTVGSLFGQDAHKKDEASISPYQAVATALASTVGTGNITGVATAIVAGGPGAVFCHNSFSPFRLECLCIVDIRLLYVDIILNRQQNCNPLFDNIN